MTQDELLALIEQLTCEDQTSLDLGGKRLTELPPEIAELTQLKRLNLGKYNDKWELALGIYSWRQTWLANELTRLPTEIGQLKSLQYLDLNSNQLHKLPSEIGKLTILQYLDLRFNQLIDLPAEIGQLKALQYLDLNSNQLRVLPSEIGNIRTLQHLDLCFNQLIDLPADFFQLTSLRRLDLSSNLLSSLPSQLGKLTSLQHLDLSDNCLFELPSEIAQLKQLQSLNLSSNYLKELPVEISQLKYLKHLYLAGNPLEDPPPEIIAEGTASILAYLRQKLEQSTTSLYEAKFLILGEGGVGKTTLTCKLINPDFELDTQQHSTKGIDVLQWNFALTDNTNFQAYIWDFGGQEIYHATHQFFLTKRSLYALVVDTRQENTDLYYWLSIISLFSDDSPVLIIKNEKGDRPCNVNERQLRGEFINLKETLATNLKTNRGLRDIQQAIEQYISNLPHVGTALPKKWVEVRQVLETDPRNYISLSEYLHICETYGFTQRDDQLQLSDYLHDLGVCLHFQDDDLLRKTIILKPEWGTRAVYNALDTPEVLNNKGRFNHDLLNRIWSSDEYIDMQGELLQLMMRFKLCYEIPGRPDHYIAPQLLEPDSPDYPWDDRANLTFRYEYEFMPKGILTRLIVELHEYIEEQELVWKNGAVFTNGTTRAEVIEHYHKREIRIRISGPEPREWLAVITHELEKIHQSFERLQYKALVPCTCSECKGSQRPYAYPYERLQKFLRTRPDNTIQCQESGEMVSIQGLLDATLYQAMSFLLDKNPDSNQRSNIQGLHPQDVSQIRASAPIQKVSVLLSPKKRLKLIKKINGLPQTQFEELVFALEPPNGILPSAEAAQGNRAKPLLDWVEGSTGPGIHTVQELLDAILTDS